ncbi:aminotransferase class I/II-fold pyridoxal phosphate-dependent enzyme [Halobacillus fulvus]|nr:aminotransferase class I/II-fold pyridoxal phosphate-dependent enzyme [Halobacillus fulvus]
MKNQQYAPLYEALMRRKQQSPVSFHVPGHKDGHVFPRKGADTFRSVLELDATEITGLDDLHSPEGVIQEAQNLARDFFGSERSYFLINGSTVGNLAMVLAVCGRGDTIIVQRNCHKSVLNGIELAGAKPVFVAPQFEKETNRYSRIEADTIVEALRQYPEAKGVLLTYPDYFGRTYPLDEIAEVVHDQGIPLLVDEAHGVHFHLGKPFPMPALEAGADIVVQSAHKMAPSMTMTSFLHMKTSLVEETTISHYLQMLQSSSPSYPLMASLDLARYYLSQWTEEDRDQLLSFIEDVRSTFQRASSKWTVMPLSQWDDPLKVILEVNEGTGFDLAEALEAENMNPELATSDHVLLTIGLAPSLDVRMLEELLREVDCQLKNKPKRATMRGEQRPFPKVHTLAMEDFNQKQSEWVAWEKATGRVAAEPVIPYPPGIALLMKGEWISRDHIDWIDSLAGQGARFQNRKIKEGIRVFKGE